MKNDLWNNNKFKRTNKMPCTEQSVSTKFWFTRLNYSWGWLTLSILTITSTVVAENVQHHGRLHSVSSLSQTRSVSIKWRLNRLY